MIQELRSNPRLRIGLVLVAGILGAYALLLWQDQQRLSALKYRRLALEQQRLTQQASLRLWPERAQEAAKLLEQYEARLWHQANFGLAQAEQLDWLQRTMRALSIQGANVKVADADPTAGLVTRGDASTDADADARLETSADPSSGVWPPARVSAQLDFANSDPQVTLAFLAALVAEPRHITIDLLNIKPARVEMRISAWYVLGGKPLSASVMTR